MLTVKILTFPMILWIVTLSLVILLLLRTVLLLSVFLLLICLLTLMLSVCRMCVGLLNASNAHYPRLSRTNATIRQPVMLCSQCHTLSGLTIRLIKRLTTRLWVMLRCGNFMTCIVTQSACSLMVLSSS